MAALAVVIMSLGTLIPIATFVCPMLCMLLLTFVLGMAGNRIGWVWYVAVAVLSLILAPDKEACAVFVFFGYYPIVKPWLDGHRLRVVWKLVFFNVSIFAMYGLLIGLLGLEQVASDFQGVGTVMTIVTAVLGNITLFMVDILLGRFSLMMRKGR